MKALVLVMHDIRSALNVGSMLRTAEGLGVSKAYMTGYTPYPEHKDDGRLPHHRRRTASRIRKTALGAEQFIQWQHLPDISECFDKLRSDGFQLVALEQAPEAIELSRFEAGPKTALIVGNEITGLEPAVLKQADQIIRITMRGRKESFNVAIAAGMALYRLANS
jgi:tRNA G18 (ribose-2'-O)-methylase SpoU